MVMARRRCDRVFRHLDRRVIVGIPGALQQRLRRCKPNGRFLHRVEAEQAAGQWPIEAGLTDRERVSRTQQGTKTDPTRIIRGLKRVNPDLG